MRLPAASLVVLAAVLPALAWAQGFAALVSPPRFELTAKPGEKLRQVMEITNAGAQPAKYRLKTADWKLEADASVKFDDVLRPDSCRPWVAIESREITVASGGKHRYRFEAAVPADAPAGECRFAILVEGDEQAVVTAGGPSFPISGRLGVIVYVVVGAAEPRLEIIATKVDKVNGEEVPVLSVKNSGTAHGRLAGFLSGTDASGKKIDFTPATLPILPGETRAISLVPYKEREEAVRIAYPITIRGKLEWDGKATEIEKSFAH